MNQTGTLVSVCDFNGTVVFRCEYEGPSCIPIIMTIIARGISSKGIQMYTLTKNALGISPSFNLQDYMPNIFIKI